MSPQPTTIAHYRVVSKLGEGGMGAVYRATDTKLGRDVAIKILPDALANDPAYVARFTREAQVLATLNHPHIAAIYGIEDRAIVMELVEGRELPAPLPLEEAIPIARQIAEALEAAHEKGIVHRDLKPANIKLTPEGQVKVLDFGLAKSVESATSTGSASISPTLTIGTQVGTIMGTAAYMAPEQAAGKPVDKRADIWAFGVVLYEMLSGHRLFEAETVAHTLADVLRAPIDLTRLPANTPESIRKLLRRCLERNPRKRLRDIGEARILLEEPDSTAPKAAGPRGNARLWMASTAVLLVAGLAVEFVHFRETPPDRQLLRYSLAPPPKTTVRSFALSPDARYLAMAVQSEQGAQLWVRALDSLEPELLKGAEGASFPFWSPDSRNIAFFAQGKLKRVAVEGGSVQTLCDAPANRGGAWNREGVIVFSPSNITGLSRVSAAGGVPVEIKNDGARQRFPMFLPDGRFLYLSNAGDQKGGIFVGALNSSENRRLAGDLSSPQYVAPVPGRRVGHLLFVRDNTLMAQPVDSKNLQPAGELFPVAEHVTAALPSGNYGKYSVSENGVLVYQSGGVTDQAQLSWFDRRGKELAAVGAPFARGTLDGSAFSLSLDEKRVLVSLHTDAQRRSSELWMLDLERGTESRLSFDGSINLSPVWSPDGGQVVFSSARNGSPPNLYRKSANGAGKDEPLLKSNNNQFPQDWSPDGRFILFTSQEEKTKHDVFALPLDGDRKAIPLLQREFNERDPQVSPDGRWMAYTSDESGRYEVYVQPFPLTAAPVAGKRASGKWQISKNGGVSPRWRKDGKEMYYLTLPSGVVTLMAVDVTPGPTSFSAGVAETLFPLGSQNAAYSDFAATADGKRFLVSRPTGAIDAAPLTVVVNWLSGVRR